MTAKYLTRNKQLTFEITGNTDKELFADLARIQEVFDSEHKCGVCGSTDIRHIVRHTKGFDFFELSCRQANERGHICGARFSFGQSKTGGALFPKHKDDNGEWLPDNGWVKYKPSQKDEWDT